MERKEIYRIYACFGGPLCWALRDFETQPNEGRIEAILSQEGLRPDEIYEIQVAGPPF
jgi:hypothetical protein